MGGTSSRPAGERLIECPKCPPCEGGYDPRTAATVRYGKPVQKPDEVTRGVSGPNSDAPYLYGNEGEEQRGGARRRSRKHRHSKKRRTHNSRRHK